MAKGENPAPQKISIDEFVSKLDQIAQQDPEKAKQILAQQPPEVQQAVGAYIQQGAAAQGAQAAPAKGEGKEPVKEKKPKKPFTFKEFEEKYIRAPGRKLDGLLGSFARSAATSYNVLQYLPAIMYAPIPAIVAGTLIGFTTYIMSNVGWKCVKFPFTFTYDFVTHPIQTPLKIFTNILGWASGISLFKGLHGYLKSKVKEEPEKEGKPKGITGFILKPDNESNLGKALGLTTGGLASLSSYAPALYDKIINLFTGTFAPAAKEAYAGAASGLEKTVDLLSAVSGTVVDQYNNNIRF